MDSPAATPKTIRARWTWNQGSDRLPAISCKIGASWGAIRRGRGFRPRMGRLRRLDPVIESSVPTVPNFLHYFVPGTLEPGQRGERIGERIGHRRILVAIA